MIAIASMHCAASFKMTSQQRCEEVAGAAPATIRCDHLSWIILQIHPPWRASSSMLPLLFPSNGALALRVQKSKMMRQ